jgi:hypothetical protein
VLRASVRYRDTPLVLGGLVALCRERDCMAVERSASRLGSEHLRLTSVPEQDLSTGIVEPAPDGWR